MALPEIDVTEAARRVDAGEVHLLDVREDDEWAAGHAPQAQHVVLGALDPSAVPTDRPIAAICRSGGRSGQAAQALAAVGLLVHNVAGGMNAWAAAGLPVVGADGSPGQVI